LAEIALGKIARKTGKVYKIADFEDIEDIPEFVDAELKKYGVSPDDPVIDRKTGKKIRNLDGTGIANGIGYYMKLHHTAEGKGSARGNAGYDANEAPAKGGDTGAKRVALMHLNALVGHGAYNTFMDAKYNRGQSNEDFWMQYMQGLEPKQKKIPLVYEKFVNSLKASGINVEPADGRLNVLAMTDHNVKQLAGDREVRSGETLRWEKDKTPIGGGLFDPSIFGMNGDRWGFIKSSAPILNPVMEEPTRILLGLSNKDLQAVMGGQKEYRNYGTGMQAIDRALKDTSVDLAINQSRERIRSGNLQTRDQAIKALGYLKASKTTGIHPGDWMMNNIPVIPPKFRPVSEMADTKIPLVDDANYLYKVLIDTNNELKEYKKHVSDTKKEEYGLYESYKQVAGLAEPTNPKLVQKQVRGLLKHVFGIGSSKFSMVQRSLLGVPVDNVARGTILPDSRIDMDSVGLPEDKAWEIYRPHVMHSLSKRGFSWALAADAIEQRKPVAKDVLLEQMEARPVLADRAPVLHKWGVLALKPQLVQGDAIMMNTFVEKGLGADFDGDANLGYVILRVKTDSLPQIAMGLKLPPRLCKVRDNVPAMYEGSEYETLFTEEEKMAGYQNLQVTTTDEQGLTVLVCSLCDFPRGKKIKETQGRCGRIEWYEIPDTVQVLSYDETLKRPVWANPTVFSIHHGCEMEIVTTGGGRQVFTDNDPRAIYGINPETFQFERATPTDAKNKDFVIPRARYIPSHPAGIDMNELRKKNDPESDFDFGYAVALETEVNTAHARGQKRLPDWFIYTPDEFRFGLFAGLIDKSGGVGLSQAKTKSKPQLIVNYTATSFQLALEVQLLAASVGIAASITVSKTAQGLPCWYVVFSNRDIKQWGGRGLQNKDKKSKIDAAEVDPNSPAMAKHEQLPMPFDLLEILLLAIGSRKVKTPEGEERRKLYTKLQESRKGQGRAARVSRLLAEEIIALTKKYDLAVSGELWDNWLQLVNQKDVVWDYVAGIEETGKVETMYDLTVPGYETFVSSTGIVLSNTMNFHVPYSKEAIKEAKEILLPSKSLLQASDFKSAQPRIISENAGGLYLASLPPDSKERPRTFATWKDAKNAYRDGKLAIDDPVIILEK
jgi:hypothetical protein